jgi:hypothetical protein
MHQILFFIFKKFNFNISKLKKTKNFKIFEKQSMLQKQTSLVSLAFPSFFALFAL